MVGGLLYVCGGRTGRDGENLASVLRFNPHLNSWDSVTPMSKPKFAPAAAAADGRLYVLGGRERGAMLTDLLGERLSLVECFDLQTGVWQEMPPLLVPRSAALAFIAPAPRKGVVPGGAVIAWPK